MDHIFIVLHFICFSAGFSLLTLLYILNNKNESKIIKNLMLTDIFYTMLLFIDTIHLYIRKIIIHKYPIIHTLIPLFQFLSEVGLIFYLTIFVHSIIEKDFTKKQKKIYISLSAFILIVSIMYTSLTYIFELYLYSIILFNALVLMLNIDKIEKKKKNIIIILTTIILIILSIHLTTTIFQNMHYFLYKIPYTPILYFITNTLGIVYIKKNVIHSVENDKKDSHIDDEITNASEISIDEALKAYAITNRELEVIKYVIQGYSNQVISEKLFISSHTVRNHIHNIYKKLSIKNRYELISFISSIQNNKVNQ